MNDLLDKVNELALDYFGPAARQFISRQIGIHLYIDADELSAKHLEVLAEWVEKSGKRIISKEKSAELAEKIRRLNE
ncbi:MAG: hypothetical protein COB66_01160 [Coxiella sp. (in: Bacteria)]|nr:MAG: hypothetical protein COB66_01160 [Coxiella sp. (in: g-proteobacteria)]